MVVVKTTDLRYVISIKIIDFSFHDTLLLNFSITNIAPKI